MRDCSVFTLSNGIRVVHRQTNTDIVHCGMFLEIGSRDETPENQGIAHFWEHMAFKGTRRRKAFHIINSLDSIGGELNAFTEKEKVVFYASVRQAFFERAIDVISDITFNSVFPAHEIEKERGVILEEMAMYRDDPDDTLQDEFEGLIFHRHSLGMNILGREETVLSFRRRDFTSFISQHINTHKIVFSCVGNVSRDRLERLARKYLEGVPRRAGKTNRKSFMSYRPRESGLRRPVKQARCAIGREVFSLHHPKRIPFYVLTNLIGGVGMNSRLNMVLREKYGYVYSIDAHYVPYSDTGLFAITFGTEPNQLNKCIRLVNRELKRVADTPLGKRQLAALKEQIKGQLALSEENNLSLMLMMGRSILDFGRVPPLSEVYHKIDEITALELQDLAQEVFVPEKLSYLVMEPSGNGASPKDN
ncbi:MAG: pitrilysin family protein [Bacteroidota bacterium]|jgi:predicted Zn-dependent peptidase|nr:MAG: peptidase M16 [Bacteroidota bacterium]